jgi:hypothetical protein
MHRLLIAYCIIFFTSCISKKSDTTEITVNYCPEINQKNSFYIPKEITGVFKSKNIDGKNYEIITDSKIQIINGDFDNPVEVPIFNSISQMIFGSPNQLKINELITSELHTIKFEKNKSRKPYPSEPSENRIFIFYNAKNINQTVGRKYYVNSSDQISKVISKHRNDKKNFYIFNSPPHVVKTPKPAPPRVSKTKLLFEKNSIPIVLQATKSPGCILKWASKTGANVSPKISTDKLGTFKYYVSQKNLTNNLESKPIEIIVTIYEKAKPPIKKPNVLLPFSKATLGIDKDGSGHLLNWNHPIKTTQSINYKISFINNDTKESFFATTLQNQKTFNVTGLSKIGFLKKGEFPKRGVTFTITAELEGYRPLPDDRQISFMYDKDGKLTIWNCYTR